MLKVNELRITNWVLMDGEEYFIRAGEQIDDYSDRMKGILLTPKILEACGFKSKGGWMGLNWSTSYYDEPVELVFEFMDQYLSVFCADTRMICIENPHLHQLQNLYFALTGQEFEIKEKDWAFINL